MLGEFKKFALRGSVVDLAIGVIVGASFNRIVSSVVDDIFMPVIGFLAGGLDFSNYFLQLAGPPAATYEQAKAAGATIGYGQFFTILINFLIVAWVLFLVVKGINRLREIEDLKPPEAKPIEQVPPDVQLLQEIRDLLARRPG